MRRAAKVDANHAAIVDAFRTLGCSVLSLAAIGKGCPDLLVARNARTCMVEIKDGSKPPSARMLTPDQIDFHARWQGAVYVVTGADDVVKVHRYFMEG